MVRVVAVVVGLFLGGAAARFTEAEGRGCCSSHGGVCGCSGTRAVCCDGALSPSCGC